MFDIALDVSMLRDLSVAVSRFAEVQILKKNYVFLLTTCFVRGTCVLYIIIMADESHSIILAL